MRSGTCSTFPSMVDRCLPLDDTAFGFDNNADVLSVSPGLLERYMSAARRISRLAIGDRTLRPIAETYSVSDLVAQDERSSEDLPFGTRGGVVVRHYFPLDADYTLKIRLQRDKAGTGAVRGLSAGPQQIDVHLGGERVKRFTVGADVPGGRVAKPEAADSGLEVKFSARAGSSLVGVSILNRTLATEGVNPTRLPVWTFSPGNDRISIDSVEIEGPFNGTGPGDTPSRRRIFLCTPETQASEAACAKAIVTALARRAYRRPVTGRDIERLLRFYAAGRDGGDFESGIRAALESILVDPEFLFRIERDPPGVAPGTAYRLSDLELASRLSFFLWSSIPDEELLAIAERGGLGDRAVLEHQVRRMLADRRSAALVQNFGEQWLQIRSLRGVTPDVNAFPEFDDNLRAAFERETLLFLDSQVRDDRPVPELLTRELHVRQRAPGPTLRHPERLRQPLPSCGASAGSAARPAWRGKHPDRHLACDADVSRAPRQVGSREPAWCAAASAAGQCPAAEGKQGWRAGLDGPRTPGGASEEPGLCELPRPDGSDRLRARDISTRSADGATSTGQRRSMRRQRCRTERQFSGAAELRAAPVVAAR